MKIKLSKETIREAKSLKFNDYKGDYLGLWDVTGINTYPGVNNGKPVIELSKPSGDWLRLDLSLIKLEDVAVNLDILDDQEKKELQSDISKSFWKEITEYCKKKIFDRFPGVDKILLLEIHKYSYEPNDVTIDPNRRKPLDMDNKDIKGDKEFEELFNNIPMEYIEDCIDLNDYIEELYPGQSVHITINKFLNIETLDQK